MDAPFRIALAIVFASTIAIAGYHRWQAAKSGERFDRRQEGLLLAVVLRLVGFCLWAGVLAYLIYPPSMARASVPLAPWLRWSGAVFAAAGVGMMYWTLTNLGKNLTDTVQTRDQATLVTSGPYRFVRHPFYVTVALLMLGTALLSANGFIAASGLTVFVLLAVRSAKEEQKLVEKFGDGYRDYMTRTGRFVPRFGRS